MGGAWVHPTKHVLWAQLSTDNGPQEPKLTDVQGTYFVVLWPLVLGVAPPDSTPTTSSTGHAAILKGMGGREQQVGGEG